MAIDGNGSPPDLTLRLATQRMLERLRFPTTDRSLRDMVGWAGLVMIAHPDGRIVWSTFEGEVEELQAPEKVFSKFRVRPAVALVLESFVIPRVELHG